MGTPQKVPIILGNPQMTLPDNNPRAPATRAKGPLCTLPRPLLRRCLFLRALLYVGDSLKHSGGLRFLFEGWMS